jgi:hypothetical protein
MLMGSFLRRLPAAFLSALAAAVATLALLVPAPALAQAFPSMRMTLVVP